MVLFIHPTEYPLSRQGSHFLEWQGNVISVSSVALELRKNSVAFRERMNQYTDTPDRWPIAHFGSSSTRLKNRAN